MMFNSLLSIWSDTYVENVFFIYSYNDCEYTYYVIKPKFSTDLRVKNESLFIAFHTQIW